MTGEEATAINQIVIYFRQERKSLGVPVDHVSELRRGSGSGNGLSQRTTHSAV